MTKSILPRTKWARVLHLSDLHRLEPGQNHESSEDFCSNLRNDVTIAYQALRHRVPVEDYNIGAPDLIVVTGDLIQGCTNSRKGSRPVTIETARKVVKAQYKSAAKCLGLLADEFLDGDRSRLVLCPGNHDVFWPDSLSNKAYKLQEYALFFNRFYGAKHGVPPFQQSRDYRVAAFEDYGICIASLSSLEPNTKKAPQAVGFHKTRANAAAQELSAMVHGGLFGIVAWHHPLTQGLPGQTDFVELKDIKRFSSVGAKLFLHGHAHRQEAFSPGTNEPYLSLGAGTPGVGMHARPEATPQQYTLLAIDPGRQQTIAYPRKRLVGEPWEADASDGLARIYDLSGTATRIQTLAPSPRRVIRSLINLTNSSGERRELASSLAKAPPNLTSSIPEKCSRAYRQAGIHSVLTELLSSEDAAIWVYVKVNNQYCTVPIKTEDRYSAELATDHGIDAEHIHEDAKRSERHRRMGHWLISRRAGSSLQSLGTILEFSTEVQQWKHECDALPFQAETNGEHEPAVRYFTLPAKHDGTKVTGKVLSSPQFQVSVNAIGDCLGVRGKAREDLAAAMHETEVAAQDKHMGTHLRNALHMPIGSDLRLSLIVSPGNGAMVPRDLERLLVMRRCVERLHAELAKEIAR